VSKLSLPQDVSQTLDEFLAAATGLLGPDLVSVVLFGSAAEGRMRATSDVNLMLVLSRFDAVRMDALREPLRTAHTLIRLQPMLILESELAAAADAFAVKFADIRQRHALLQGRDLLSGLAPARDAMRVRLRQILLNFILRARERYALVSLREEQLVSVIADAAGPLRSAAALILELEGRPAGSPKAALERLAAEIDAAPYRDALANLSRAREEAALPPGAGKSTLLRLIDLAQALRERAVRLA
jgi:predicted nucleotidyltransferase